jgi:hypothetical protein
MVEHARLEGVDFGIRRLKIIVFCYFVPEMQNNNVALSSVFIASACFRTRSNSSRKKLLLSWITHVVTFPLIADSSLGRNVSISVVVPFGILSVWT